MFAVLIVQQSSFDQTDGVTKAEGDNVSVWRHKEKTGKRIGSREQEEEEKSKLAK